MTRVYGAASGTNPIVRASRLFLGHQIALVLLWAATILVLYGTLPLDFELRLFAVLTWVAASGIALDLLSRANHRKSQAIYKESVSLPASVTNRIAEANQLFLGRQIVMVSLWFATALVVYGALPVLFELRLFVVLAWAAAIGLTLGRQGRSNHRESQAIYKASVSQIRGTDAETVLGATPPEVMPATNEQPDAGGAIETAGVPRDAEDPLVAMAGESVGAGQQPGQ